MPARPVKDRSRPWNRGLLVGQKKPLQPKHVWCIRVRLEIARMWRDLALFNLAIDSKLRACGLANFAWTRSALEQRCGSGQRSFKGRPVDQSSSRSRSRHDTPLKLGCKRFGQLALNISSPVGFMRGLTYPPDNMPGSCIVGSKASAL